MTAVSENRLVSGTDFICIATRDIEAARKFYEEVLGLEPANLWQRGGTPPVGAEFETGNLTLALVDSDALGIGFQANNHPIALHVDDFEGAKATLESHGVEFKGETIDSGVCWQAFFEDPDGNAIGIHHRYAPR
ncbi:MAG TPA: VOC family protein [Solirubrobacterales bacterium]|nr:VOC family protein [Solirubrobacterales bacterium]